MVSCTAWPLYPPDKESQLPIEWDAGWASEAVWALWRRESLALYRNPAMIPRTSILESSHYTDRAILACTEGYIE